MLNAYSIHINVDWGDEDEQWNRLTKICEWWARVLYSKTQSSNSVGYEKNIIEDANNKICSMHS